MLNQLRIQRDIVALEAFAVSDVTGLLNNIFPSMKETFLGFMRSYSPSEAAVSLSGNYKDFLKEIPKHNYTDIRSITAYVPEGLNTDYKEYGDYLQAAVAHATAVMDDVLNPYSTYLAQLVTNHDMRLSTNTFETVYKPMEEKRDLLTKDMAGCFKKGSTQSVSNIGKVISRNADWEDLFVLCERLTQQVGKVDRVKLKKKIGECTEYLEAIERKLKRADMEGVAPQVIQNLSNGAYQVACELQFFSVVYYKVEVFVNCVNRTLNNFATVMKR